jgi:hypothetical protein
MPIRTTRDLDANLTVHVVTGPAEEAEIYAALEGDGADSRTALVLWDMTAPTWCTSRRTPCAPSSSGPPSWAGSAPEVAPPWWRPAVRIPGFPVTNPNRVRSRPSDRGQWAGPVHSRHG